MRPLNDVITAICNIIPEDYSGKQAFVAEASMIAERTASHDDEAVHRGWNDFVRLLATSLPKPSHSDSPAWIKEVVAVFSDNEVYMRSLSATQTDGASALGKRDQTEKMDFEATLPMPIEHLKIDRHDLN